MLLCRTAKAEKKVRVNDREDTLCELKVVGCLLKKIGAADHVSDGMEQSWITAHMFQLTCLLPTCGETGLYISVCEGSDQRARFASKACFDLRSLRVQEISKGSFVLCALSLEE